MLATPKGGNIKNRIRWETPMMHKERGQDKEQTNISFIHIRISKVLEKDSTQASYNHLRRQLNSIMSNLLQIYNTIIFMQYYVDSMMPETIKVDDITTTIHRHKKFLQSMYLSSKGGTYWVTTRLAYQYDTGQELLLTLQYPVDTSIIIKYIQEARTISIGWVYIFNADQDMGFWKKIIQEKVDNIR